MFKFVCYAIVILLGVGGPAAAAPVLLESNHIRVTIGEEGTLGNGDGPGPGLQYDATGTRTFGSTDFLKPGSPWEFFSLKANETGVIGNNNDRDVAMRDFRKTYLADLSGLQGYDHHVRWFGTNEAMLVGHDYFFNNDDKYIQVRTTVVALLNLTGLRFARGIDPNQDADVYAESHTLNGRGHDAQHDGDYDDAGDVAPRDWVHAQGGRSGLIVGLYSDMTMPHDTGVTSEWTTDPDFFLGGFNEGDGDLGLGLAFHLGELPRHHVVTLMYAYVLGDSLDGLRFPMYGPQHDKVSIGRVPEPGSLALMILGISAWGVFVRRMVGHKN